MQTATLILKGLTILIYLVGFIFLIRGAVRTRSTHRHLQRTLQDLDASTQRLTALIRPDGTKPDEPMDHPAR